MSIKIEFIGNMRLEGDKVKRLAYAGYAVDEDSRKDMTVVLVSCKSEALKAFDLINK